MTGAVARMRVVNKEAPVQCVLRMKCEAKKAALSAGENLQMNVEENGRRRGVRLKDLDDSALLDDEDPIGVVSGICEEDGTGQSAHDRSQLNSALQRMRNDHQRGEGRHEHDLAFSEMPASRVVQAKCPPP